MTFRSRSTLAFALCLLTSACVKYLAFSQTNDVQIVNAYPTERYEYQIPAVPRGASFVRIRIETDIDIDDWASEAGRKVQARVFVCGDERMHSFGADLFPNRTDGQRDIQSYFVYLPREMSTLPRRELDGEITHGWDGELIRTNGLCLKLSGGSEGLEFIMSPTIRLSEETAEAFAPIQTVPAN